MPPERTYTDADLLSLEDGTRYELYGGRLVTMSSPSDLHQASWGGKYDPPVFCTRNAKAPSCLWEDFALDLRTVFPE